MRSRFSKNTLGWLRADWAAPLMAVVGSLVGCTSDVPQIDTQASALRAPTIEDDGREPPAPRGGIVGARTTPEAVSKLDIRRRWDDIATGPLIPSCPSPTDYSAIPNDNGVPYVGDDNSTAAILAESDRFWWKYFGEGDANQNGLPDDIDGINDYLSHNGPINAWWYYAERANALVDMYDLLAPIDGARALVYLERMRQMANAFLNNRDDKRGGFPYVNQSPYPAPPFDTTHKRVMAAWGSLAPELGNKWWAQVDMSALLAYPMAAFARRVADKAAWFCPAYRQDAVRFTNAVLEMYASFRSDMALSAPNHTDWGFYVALDGKGDAWNVTLSSLKPLVEIASAADSALYRGSPEFDPVSFYYATNEAPRFIAKNAKAFADNVYAGAPSKAAGTQWSWWRYAQFHSSGQFPENLSHAEHTLRSTLLIWENRGVLDGLLARNGSAERVSGPLNGGFFTKIANTFLHRIWYYDYKQGSNLRNLLTDRIDGPNSGVYPIDAPLPSLQNDANGRPRNGNPWCAGFLPLTAFDPWVWVRSRDAVYNPALQAQVGCSRYGCTWPALGVGNHAALLRYRGAHP